MGTSDLSVVLDRKKASPVTLYLQSALNQPKNSEQVYSQALIRLAKRMA